MSNSKELIKDSELSEDQQNALLEFQKFLVSTTEHIFILAGNAGCGKSTLVNNIVNNMDKFNKSAKLINPNHKVYDVELTATTNKAAENLYSLTGVPTATIHSFLGLVVRTEYTTGNTTVTRKHKEVVSDKLIFIDESSYVDSNLLGLIFKCIENCKIVFVGDPAQLTPVKSSTCPVFNAGFKRVELTKVVRQAEGNPIIDLAMKFRDTVYSKEFFSFKPDGVHIQHLNKEAFLSKILEKFSDPNWSYNTSKVLAWTNACVVSYNNYIKEMIVGNTSFKNGDYALCNSYVRSKGFTFKANELVRIESISQDVYVHEVLGNYMNIYTKFDPSSLNNDMVNVFVPKSFHATQDRIKLARSIKDYDLANMMETEWMDLRAVYACTINKAQGSTYDEVFIDLDDICKCNSGDQIARMLYVAVSRARHHVYLTGDLINK